MSDFDPTRNRVPFGLLTEEERAVLRLWPHGCEIYVGEGIFVETGHPEWWAAIVYRAKPAPLPSEPQIATGDR